MSVRSIDPSGSPASLVLTTSFNAHIGLPNSSIYGSRAALLSLARTLSGELIPRGIRVNAISTGPTSTPLYDKLGLPKADLKAMAHSRKQSSFHASDEAASGDR